MSTRPTTAAAATRSDPAASPAGDPAGLASRDGFPVTAWWHAAAASGPARGVAVLAPGVAVPARVLTPLAGALAGRGWDVLRVEFPGVGESPVHPRDVPGGMAEWGTRDLDTALRAAAERAGDRPLVLVGHSAGAWLVGLTPMAARVDAVLAIASMSGAWRGLRRSSWPQVWFAFTVAIPLAARVVGHVPGALGLGEDAPGGAMAQWASWCRRRGFLFDDPTVDTHLDRLEAPTRVLLPTDDAWATERAVDAFWGHVPGGYELVTVDPADHGGPIGHVGLLRDRFADTVWAANLDWLEEATADR